MLPAALSAGRSGCCSYKAPWTTRGITGRRRARARFSSNASSVSSCWLGSTTGRRAWTYRSASAYPTCSLNMTYAHHGPAPTLAGLTVHQDAVAGGLPQCGLHERNASAQRPLLECAPVSTAIVSNRQGLVNEIWAGWIVSFVRKLRPDPQHVRDSRVAEGPLFRFHGAVGRGDAA